MYYWTAALCRKPYYWISSLCKKRLSAIDPQSCAERKSCTEMTDLCIEKHRTTEPQILLFFIPPPPHHHQPFTLFLFSFFVILIYFLTIVPPPWSRHCARRHHGFLVIVWTLQFSGLTSTGHPRLSKARTAVNYMGKQSKRKNGGLTCADGKTASRTLWLRDN